MYLLKALRAAARLGILATYVILAGSVIFYPVLYSLEEGLFTMLRVNPLQEFANIKDSLVPMFLAALLCVVFRLVERTLSFVIKKTDGSHAL